MASTSAVSMALTLTFANHRRQPPNSDALIIKLLRPVKRPSKAIAMISSRANVKFQVQASLKEKAVTGLTAAALTVSMVIPEVAEAAELSPSLKNFLLSIVAGGVVLTVIIGAVIGVANFDPVKRS